MKEFKDAKAILFYISYGNEVDTHQMIKDCISIEKKVVVPKTDRLHKRIVLSELSKWNNLAYGEYNILEPKKE